jgi:PAS domain S-box-containing protein
MLITDSSLNISSVNPAFTRITGYTPEEVLGQNPARFCSGHHNQAFIDEMRQSIEATSHWEGEAWDMKKSGEVFAVHLSISAIPDDTGTGRRYAAQFSDITEKKRMDEIVARHANFDSLTGLPNRRLFRDRLEQEIKKAHRTRNNLALMFIDLDHFKESTTCSGTTSATSCWWKPRNASSHACANPTPSRAWAATSSPSSCPRSPTSTASRTWPMPSSSR